MSKQRLETVAVGVLLAFTVMAVFGQVVGHEFLNFDDGPYVYENAVVRGGLSVEGVKAAFTTTHSYSWHPLTTLSHMLDSELYGMNPAGHHLSSLLIHCATSILLFLLFRSMTGSLWRSAAVALLFALHPLRAESVAWVSERKDVLCGLFFVLTLGAYVSYTRHRDAEPRFPFGRYLLVLVCLALGLMAKPMLVTMPFVLLLLDFWPLERLGEGSASGQRTNVLVEKVPVVVLSLAFSVLTILTQRGAMTSTEALSLGERLGNSVLSYVIYIRQLFLPFDLAAVYPHAQQSLPVWQIGLALLLLVSVTVWVVVYRKSWPFLAVGWFWYVGMLVPVSGLVQVGVQAHADRYTYLPHIGLYLMLVWGVAAWWPAHRLQRRVATVAVLVILGILGWLARAQTSHWRSSEALWRHTLAHTTRNSLAHAQLGAALMSEGEIPEAVQHLQMALVIRPDYPTPRYNLGTILARQGQLDAAIEQFRLAVQAKPDYAKAHNNLGTALHKRGRLDEAIASLARALEIDPSYAQAHLNLAAALTAAGRLPEAETHYHETLRLEPSSPEAHLGLGGLVAQLGRMAAASEHFRRATVLDPSSARAHASLALALEQQGDRAQALAHYQRALELAEARGDQRLSLMLRQRLGQAPPTPNPQ